MHSSVFCRLPMAYFGLVIRGSSTSRHNKADRGDTLGKVDGFNTEFNGPSERTSLTLFGLSKNGFCHTTWSEMNNLCGLELFH